MKEPGKHGQPQPEFTPREDVRVGVNRCPCRRDDVSLDSEAWVSCERSRVSSARWS